MAFMPFVTAGDPDMAATTATIRELTGRGVDLIEVGFPYSDPIADGPVIQAAYTRALDKGLRVDEIFEGIAALDSEQSPPLLAMVSYAIIFRSGVESFLTRAHAAGFSGLIVPDLPGDEAGEFAGLAKTHQLDLIQLISPLTPPERVERILQSCSGFVYCISVAGTTGTRDQLPAELHDQLKSLRDMTDLPLAVGFGISRPDQVAGLRPLADGVIVGSAIVREFQPSTDEPVNVAAAIERIGVFASRILAETKTDSST